MSAIKKFLLRERYIFTIIFLNAIIIFIQEMGVNVWWLNLLDALCTLIFTAEMIVKQKEWGVKAYWKEGWNCMDGILVILSIPSLFYYLWPEWFFNVSFVLVLRLLRIFRFFRIFHLFPDFVKIVHSVKLAMKQCFSVFIGFGILLFVFALISCALFSQASPEYFGNPLDSLYSTFRMCTIEGWYDIPEAVSANSPLWTVTFIRLYFITILVSLGIIGMSIINSIFVDAMVSDNNDEVLKKIDEIDRKLENLNSSKLSIK